MKSGCRVQRLRISVRQSHGSRTSVLACTSALRAARGLDSHQDATGPAVSGRVTGAHSSERTLPESFASRNVRRSDGPVGSDRCSSTWIIPHVRDPILTPLSMSSSALAGPMSHEPPGEGTYMEWLSLERWSPYVVGIGIGVLSWLAFLLSDRPLACSTPFARTAGMLERLFRGEKVLRKAYYQRFAPIVDWQWMLVAGVVAGAFISAELSDQFQLKWLPVRWIELFGHTPIKRWAVALAGGVLMGLGSRWADGCTSGHGISGTLQLAVSSWIAAICFFTGGIATALLLY